MAGATYLWIPKPRTRIEQKYRAAGFLIRSNMGYQLFPRPFTLIIVCICKATLAWIARVEEVGEETGETTSVATKAPDYVVRRRQTSEPKHRLLIAYELLFAAYDVYPKDADRPVVTC
mgnify:CR=1 FL=1